MKIKKSIVYITVILVSLMFVWASESGPKLVNINPPDISAKQADVFPGSVHQVPPMPFRRDDSKERW